VLETEFVRSGKGAVIITVEASFLAATRTVVMVVVIDLYIMNYKFWGIGGITVL
jgi:hypothetical protein